MIGVIPHLIASRMLRINLTLFIIVPLNMTSFVQYLYLHQVIEFGDI